MDPIINKTGRAVIAIAIIVFCLGDIVWLQFYGKPDNSLHASSLSWAWWAVTVMSAALGLNVTADVIAQMVTRKTPS